MNVIQKKLEVDDDDGELCSVVMFFIYKNVSKVR